MSPGKKALTGAPSGLDAKKMGSWIEQDFIKTNHKERGRAKNAPEGLNFFQEDWHQYLFVQNFTFTFYDESKTLLFLFSKRQHVTRAGVPKHVMQSCNKREKSLRICLSNQRSKGN